MLLNAIKYSQNAKMRDDGRCPVKRNLGGLYGHTGCMSNVMSVNKRDEELTVRRDARSGTETEWCSRPWSQM